MKILLLLVALLGFLHQANAAKRLTVSGSKLLDPSGNRIRLTGFNWLWDTTYHVAHDEGAYMKSVLPGANVWLRQIWNDLEELARTDWGGELWEMLGLSALSRKSR